LAQSWLRLKFFNQGWVFCHAHGSCFLAGLAAATWLLSLATALQPFPSQAQISPRCRRNGRLDYCAVPPQADAQNAKRLAEVLVFANGDTYRLTVDEASCRNISASQRICEASLQSGYTAPVRATYIGSAYEGGYRHEYTTRGLSLVVFHLD
jgi:hypothetical protein